MSLIFNIFFFFFSFFKNPTMEWMKQNIEYINIPPSPSYRAPSTPLGFPFGLSSSSNLPFTKVPAGPGIIFLISVFVYFLLFFKLFVCLLILSLLSFILNNDLFEINLVFCGFIEVMFLSNYSCVNHLYFLLFLFKTNCTWIRLSIMFIALYIILYDIL